MFYKPSGSQLKLWKSLDRAQVRRQEGLFLAEGFKIVDELLKSTWKVNALLVMEQKKKRWEAFLSELPGNIDIYGLTDGQWQRLSQDKNPEGMMAVASHVRQDDISHLPEAGHILLLCGVNNPLNLGALLRTAHWFGFGAVLLSGDAVDFTNPKVVRTSMGSLFHIAIIPDVDFHQTLPKLKESYLLVASNIRNGINPHPCSRRMGLLLGSESHGLPENLLENAEETWSIPGAGGAESLSLPQAAAIMMYEASRSGD